MNQPTIRPSLLARLVVLLAVLSGDASAQGGSPGTGTLAITNVNVITMAGTRRLADATVIVQGGRITAVGPAARTTVPAGARRVDGQGRYLIPGLADMHGHLFADDWVADSVAPYELGVYLAHGITSARLQIGTPQHLTLRRQIRMGDLAGPRALGLVTDALR